MIVLVTGGRDFRDWNSLSAILTRLHAARGFTYLVHGDARGADQMAHRWAKKAGVQPVAMEALWGTEGDAAGSLRNQRMLTFATPDLCVAFSGGRGTANMMRIARESGVELIDAEDIKL